MSDSMGLSVPGITTDVKSPPRRPLRVLVAIGWFAVVSTLAGLALAAAWPARLHVDTPFVVSVSYVTFMIETFALHAGLALVVVALFGLCTRRRWLLAFATIGSLWGAGPTLVPWALSSGRSATLPQPHLRVLSMNLMYGRVDADAVMRIVERERPDVLLLQEWTPAADGTLRDRLHALFPHELLTPKHDAFGQASFSCTPMLDARVFPRADYNVPAHTFDVECAGRMVRIVNVHVLPPIGLAYFGEQRQQTEVLAQCVADWTAGRSRGVVLAGDFNAVWRSAHGRRLRDAGLIDARAQSGGVFDATWPRGGGALRLWPGLALDHVLIGGGLGSAGFRVLQDIGSDHAPVVVNVAWSP